MSDEWGPEVEDRVGVAAFDFDGTLIWGDSFTTFLIGLRGWPRFVGTFALSLTRVFVGHRFRLDRDTSKADLVARLLAGHPAERMARHAEEFGDRLADRVRPGMRSRIEWHRAQGHRLLLVSASPEVYLVPLGRHLGFDAVLATRLEIGPDQRLTGRLDGANCRGPEKEIRVRAWLDDHLAGRPVELWAYGDSPGDREMLAMADHPRLLTRRDHFRTRRDHFRTRWYRPRRRPGEGTQGRARARAFPRATSGGSRNLRR
ncbi:MAG: HAD-IB family hydrolase [Actinomycetota bacterium]|nr:HAD-IB family hydrolase [Actinomycetota bacterium]